MTIILASESPRRFELLKRLNLPFCVKSAKVTELEKPENGVPVQLLPELNAERKASAVSELYPDALVIGADTAIIFQDRLIGKPADPADARRILSELSGMEHQVVTGIAVLCKNSSFRQCWSESSGVLFKELNDTVIGEYIHLVNVLDKAGAYAIQEHGDMIIREISGDMDNIIGLPLAKLEQVINRAIEADSAD